MICPLCPRRAVDRMNRFLSSCPDDFLLQLYIQKMFVKKDQGIERLPLC
jgi:hypothetical protein